MCKKHVFLFCFATLLLSTVLAQIIPQSSAIPNATSVIIQPAAYNNTLKVNFVRTREAIAPIADISSFNTAGYTQVKEATQYMDGLGRPLQTVVKQASPQLKDLVSPVIYDEYGREKYNYLPFVSSAADGNFKLNPFSQQQSFMQSQYTGEQVFYSITEYEASPLNRVVKTMAAGNSWAGNGLSLIHI